MRAFAVIPALDEREAIEAVVGGLEALCAGVVVVDGGSRDGTAGAARRAGADVVLEPRRGYGLAMATGLARARALGAEAFVSLDGNGTVASGDVRRVLDPVLRGDADVAVGSRPAAALRPLQRAGNQLAVRAIRLAHGVVLRDVGSIRAFTAEAHDRLELDELTYGWPLQLLARAARRGLRVEDVPISVRPRRSRSKVSGTLRGTIGASLCFARVLVAECRP